MMRFSLICDASSLMCSWNGSIFVSSCMSVCLCPACFLLQLVMLHVLKFVNVCGGCR